MHYTKSYTIALHTAWKVSIFGFFWSVFSCIQTEYGDFTSQISVFSPKVGKYGLEKLRIRTASLHAVLKFILDYYFKAFPKKNILTLFSFQMNSSVRFANV